jgi:hypothetical protein
MFAFRRGGYKRESASGVFTPREHIAVGPALSALREAAIVPPDLESLGGDEEQQHYADREGNAVAVSEEVRPDPEHGCERNQPRRGGCWGCRSRSRISHLANWR